MPIRIAIGANHKFESYKNSLFSLTLKPPKSQSMKFTLTFLLCCIFVFSAEAVTHKKWQDVVSETTEIASLNNANVSIDMEAFLNLSPKKYRALTGERLGIKGSLALKAAQKQVKKMNRSSYADIPQGIYVLMVILGLGWLAMGLMDDFEGNNWWINLLLALLCWLPGLIHGLVKMKEYY